MGIDDVESAAGRWPCPVMRVGRKVGRTVYRQLGPEPSDADPLIGLMDTPGLAAAVVGAINAAWELTAYFETEAALDPHDSQAQWALELLRPIWATGDLPPGGPPN